MDERPIGGGEIPGNGDVVPGFALMLESLNMAHMMELPMLIVLAQRLGPSTGSATTGAEGDLLLLRGAISADIPSRFFPCHRAPTAEPHGEGDRRLPQDEDARRAPHVEGARHDDVHGERRRLRGDRAGEMGFEHGGTVPPLSADRRSRSSLRPLGDARFQVRFNASTHDETGLIRKTTRRRLRTRRD